MLRTRATGSYPDTLKGSPMLTALLTGWNQAPLWLKIILVWLSIALVVVWPIARFCGLNRTHQALDRQGIPRDIAPQAGKTREERGAWMLDRLDERGLTEVQAHVIDDAAPLNLDPEHVRTAGGTVVRRDGGWHRPSPVVRRMTMPQRELTPEEREDAPALAALSDALLNDLRKDPTPGA